MKDNSKKKFIDNILNWLKEELNSKAFQEDFKIFLKEELDNDDDIKKFLKERGMTSKEILSWFD